jgi:hypothetical protein
VNVQIGFLEHVGGNAKALSAGTNHRACGFDGFLHDIAERAGTDDIALAGHFGALDGEQFAAHFGPGQASHLSNLVFLFLIIFTTLLIAEIKIMLSAIKNRSAH